MNYALVGLYGLYLVFVGIKGNEKELFTEIGADAKGFAPWLIAILILKALYSVDSLKPVVKPFAALALITFTLKNYPVIISQVNEITGLNLKGGSPTFVNTIGQVS